MDFKNMDILLVDDNPINLKVLKDSIKKLNCKTYAASDGIDALSILERVTPSLIISDIMMPEMDGFDLCNKIKENERLSSVPIIFITALSDIENEAKALEVGAVDFITKPFNPKLVMARVQNQLKLRFLQESLELKAETKGEQFFSIFENAPDAIILVNYISDKIVMANRAALDLFNKSREELMGLSPIKISRKLITTIHGVDYSLNEIIDKSLKGELTSFEWIYKSSHSRDIHCEVRIIKFPGEEPLLRVSIIDISSRKEEENSFKRAHSYINNIINSLPMVLVGLDSDLKVTHWNIRAKEYTGVDLLEAVGQNIISIIPHIKLEYDLIKESIRDKVVKKRHKKSRITDKGTIFENITIFPISENGVKGVVLLIDNITDQIELQGMVIQSERMYSIGELASGVAHEITNPLAGIIQNGQSLLNRLTTDLPANKKAAMKYNIDLAELKNYLDERKIIKMIESIRSSGVKASHIIKNLSNFSKKDAGGLTYNDILPLIDQGLELAKSDYNIEFGYDFKDINIIKNIDRDSYLVLCEPGKIIQVMLNIFRFAAKNIGKGGREPEIVIKILQRDKFLEISIKDNGISLTDEEYNMLMRPYFKGKPTIREEWYTLSLSHFIIQEVHNGDLKIHSGEGVGNEVVITLPTSQ